MSDKIDLLIRTLQLAAFGLGKNSPDPMSGWVLASDNQSENIRAEGWLPEKDILSTLLSINFDKHSTKEQTLYINTFISITLELIQVLSDYHITKICVAGVMSDNVKQQIPKGIETEEGLLLKEELYLNRRFYTYSENQRPYIILKWAETADSFIARENYDSKWISSPQSRRLVHKWRAEEDAIMVGTNTAHYDNPKLNVRSWSGRDPIRVVIDKQLRLDKQLHLFNGSQPTLCYNLHIDQTQDNLSWICIREGKDDLIFLRLMLKDLRERKIQSVLIEGGSQLLHFLIKHQLWDEARVFASKQIFGKGISAPNPAQQFLIKTSFIDNDLLKIYQKTKS